MPRNTARKAARQFIDLSIAAPEVIAHRMVRMASAGGVLNGADRQELSRMSLEKWEAVWLAWVAMGTAGAAFWMRMATSWSPWPATAHPMSSHHTLEGLLGQITTAGLAPYVRMAKANRRRLRRRVTSSPQ